VSDKEIKILIVDDADINRQIIKTLFEKEYDIYEAGDGIEALHVLESVSIDIIILDLVMPKMDGIEFLQIIKSDERYQHISVIVSSVAGSIENELQVLKLGADNFITKPFNPKIIVHRVHSIVKTYIESRRELEKEAEDLNRNLYSYMEMIPGGFCVVRKADVYQLIYANSQLCKFMGYVPGERKELLNVDVMNHIATTDRERLSMLFSTAYEKGNAVDEISLLRRDGVLCDMAIEIKSDVQPSGSMQFLVVLTPVSRDEKEMTLQQELYKSRSDLKRDYISGVYNKLAFCQATKEMLHENPNRSFVVGLWNFDKFKAINDLYGSSTGDEILRSFGKLFGKYGPTLCTYGRAEADNFVTCCTKEFLESHAVELEDFLMGKIKWYPINTPVQLHVGFYSVEFGEDDVMLMCDRAAMALQPVKDSYVKRTAYFSAEMREAYVKEQQMMRDAESAILNHEFFLVYQPIINVKSKRIVSAEALVRWKKSDGEIVSPGDFIPVFEKNGFISKLDMYVCEEVCKFQSRRLSEGKSLVPISVNLSRVDFLNDNLNHDICTLLQKYGVESKWLKLEITESAYMDRTQEIVDTIAEFQNAGFAVLMDDFGSGFSSLNMLKDLSADILKIDMRFMDDLETSEKAGSILYSIIQMAKNIRMEVIAEGVENVNQYEMLFNMQCDSIQGYYFYRPLPEEEFCRKLDEDVEVEHDIKTNERAKVLLLAENEHDAAELSYQISELCNLRVFYDAVEFYTVLKKEVVEIDFAIIDLSSDFSAALELLKRIQAKEYLSELPILVFAEQSSQAQAVEAFEAGAFDLVYKPVDYSMLYLRLRKVFCEIEKSFRNRSFNPDDHIANVRRRLQHSLEVSTVSVAKFNIKSDEDLTITDLFIVNERFLYLHQLMQEEVRNKKTFRTLMHHAMPLGLDRMIHGLKMAINQGRDYYQQEYFIVWENGKTHKMLLNATIQRMGDFTYIDLVEIENRQSAEYKVERLINRIFGRFAMGSNISLWRYYLSTDRLEYFRTDLEGSSSRAIIHNGAAYFAQFPGLQESDRPRVKSIFNRIVAGSDIVDEEFALTEENGKIRYLVFSSYQVPALNADDNVILILVRDVTNDKLIEEQRWNEAQYWKKMARGVDLFVEADLTSNRIVSDLTWDHLKQYGVTDKTSYDGISGFIISSLSPDERESVVSFLDRYHLVESMEAGKDVIKFDFLADFKHDGLYVWYNADIYLFKNENNGHVYASIQVNNIQAEYRREQIVKEIGELDRLTGVCNRVMIEQSVNRTLENSEPEDCPAFFMIDIDQFNQVNECFGREFGDDCLRAIANLIRQSVGKNDIVARIGGDEFAVFVPQSAGREQVLKMAERICNDSKIYFDNEGNELIVACSVGVMFADQNTTFEEACSHSADALKQAKINGGDGYFVYAE